MFRMQTLLGASNGEISFTYLLFDMDRTMPQMHCGYPQHQRLSCTQPSTLKHREVSTWLEQCLTTEFEILGLLGLNSLYSWVE